MQYDLKSSMVAGRLLVIPEEADSKYADLRFQESPRRIGGDKGDILHEGYVTAGGQTALYRPIFETTIEGLSQDDAFNLAQEVLDRSYEAIGVECVTHG